MGCADRRRDSPVPQGGRTGQCRGRRPTHLTPLALSLLSVVLGLRFSELLGRELLFEQEGCWELMVLHRGLLPSQSQHPSGPSSRQEILSVQAR